MITRYGLSISKVRGQGYDGASNMRGQFHGLQRLLLNENFLHPMFCSSIAACGRVGSQVWFDL
jgi:hypothetical protein